MVATDDVSKLEQQCGGSGGGGGGGGSGEGGAHNVIGPIRLNKHNSKAYRKKSTIYAFESNSPITVSVHHMPSPTAH